MRRDASRSGRFEGDSVDETVSASVRLMPELVRSAVIWVDIADGDMLGRLYDCLGIYMASVGCIRYVKKRKVLRWRTYIYLYSHSLSVSNQRDVVDALYL